MQIPEIKAALDILQIAEELGIQIDKKTKRACCPFHQDKTPSLQFSKEKQIVTCFSSKCTAGTMDVIELVKRKMNLTNAETLKYLTEKVGVNTISKKSTSPKIELSNNQINYDEDFSQMQSSFISSSTARTYTESRFLDRNKVEIGYNAFKQSRFPYLRGCITFALRDENNKIVSMYGRSVRNEDKAKHYYTSNRKGLYPKYPAADTKKIIICESIVDCASLQSVIELNGLDCYSLLSIYGTNGLTAEHIYALQNITSLEEIILFFDGDEAGKEANKKHSKYLAELFPETKIKIVQTPENEDINSLLFSHEKPIFEHLIKNSKSFFLSDEKKNEKIISEVKSTVSVESIPIMQPSNNLIISLKGSLLRNEESLKVTLEITNTETTKKIRDRVELYEYKQVDRLIKLISEKLYIPENEADDAIHTFISKLEQQRDEQKSKKNMEHEIFGILSKHELEECIKFGKSENLLKKLNDLIGLSGIVGEEKNRLFLFAIASSFRMRKTLHVVVQGSSGSGKTHLIKKIADLMPQQKVKRFTRITEKSFYNYGEYDLKNTLIVLEDYDGMKEEAEFALRELQSNEILISSTSKKDESTGEIKSGENKVRGPIASMVATTNGELYHDNSTRVFFITIDETKEQTAQILNYTNKLASGEINQEEQKKNVLFVQNYISSLESLEVKNTWIKHIDLPVNLDQKRRLHSLFEAFCQQITLLHQHQRRKDDKNRVITEKQDIEQAIDLMFESIVLKVDELNGRLRDFYEKVKEFVLKNGKEYEFSQLEIRQHLSLSKTHTFRNLTELLELEYIQKTYSSQRNTHHYKICFWDNQEALRSKIKQSIENQLSEI